MAKLKNDGTFAGAELQNRKDELARGIRKIARDNNWSNLRLAKECHCSRSVIAFIVNGDDALVSLDTLYVAAVHLGLIVSMTVTEPA